MQHKLMPPWIIYFIFILGLISAFLFRIIILLNYFEPEFARLAWYIGVTGYIIFFGFRYYISRRRRKTITENNLLSKIKKSDLSDEDKDHISYILSSVVKSREMFNYIFIFIMSGVAILADILLTLLIK